MFCQLQRFEDTWYFSFFKYLRIKIRFDFRNFFCNFVPLRILNIWDYAANLIIFNDIRKKICCFFKLVFIF